MLHSSIVASPIPGTPDLQSLRWRLVSGSLCVCSFDAPHAGIATDTRIQFWRALAASVHRVSQLHSGIPLLLAEDSNIWFPFFQIGRSRQADAPLFQSHSLVFRNPPNLPKPSLWCRSGRHSLNTNSQADIQVALDAVHAWSMAFLFWCRPHQVRYHGLLVFCAAALTAVYILAALPFSWRPRVDFISFTRPVPGALVKVSLFPFVVYFHHLCSLQLIIWSRVHWC